MAARSYLIGIGGPSGAGKSYLACHLAERLRAPVLALDHYYRDLSHLPLEERARSNFDDPAALEDKLLVEHINELREGKAVQIPTYDFSAHTRTRETQPFQSAQFVIVEGLFSLHWLELRSLFGTRVYVDMTDDACLQRRQERDVRERGRNPESVIEQFRATVAPMAERYVRPTRAHAHVVVLGADPVAEAVESVLEQVWQNLQEPDIPGTGIRIRRSPSPSMSSR